MSYIILHCAHLYIYIYTHTTLHFIRKYQLNSIFKEQNSKTQSSHLLYVCVSKYITAVFDLTFSSESNMVLCLSENLSSPGKGRVTSSEGQFCVFLFNRSCRRWTRRKSLRQLTKSCARKQLTSLIQSFGGILNYLPTTG